MKLTRKLVLARAKASDLESVKKLNCWCVFCGLLAASLMKTSRLVKTSPSTLVCVVGFILCGEIS